MRMNEEDRERIRRMYYVEKQSIHQIARAEGRNRVTVRKALSDDPKPSNPPPRKKPKPVFGAYKERVGQLLQENERLPRKQRYTAHRIFEIIRSEGYEGSETTVRLYVGRLTWSGNAKGKAACWRSGEPSKACKELLCKSCVHGEAGQLLNLSSRMMITCIH
jgi:transposase-like protein